MQAQQIFIVNPKYTSYAKQQIKKKITRIDQINYTTV